MSFSRTHLIPPVPQILTVYKLHIKVVPTDYQFPLYKNLMPDSVPKRTPAAIPAIDGVSIDSLLLGENEDPDQHNLKTCNSEDGDEIRRPKELRGHED